jgi:hypothetical protein
MKKIILTLIVTFLLVIGTSCYTNYSGTPGVSDCTNEGDIVCDDEDARQCQIGLSGFYTTRASGYDSDCADDDITGSDDSALTRAESPKSRSGSGTSAPTDSDGDGVADRDEVMRYGTDPDLADTDSDGLDDYVEIFVTGTDPLDTDTDFDGLSDYDEIVIYGTDPFETDTDGDGFSDGKEVSIGTDPAVADSDGDGIDDYEEVLVGTDPNDPTDYPIGTTGTVELGTDYVDLVKSGDLNELTVEFGFEKSGDGIGYMQFVCSITFTDRTSTVWELDDVTVDVLMGEDDYYIGECIFDLYDMKRDMLDVYHITDNYEAITVDVSIPLDTDSTATNSQILDEYDLFECFSSSDCGTALCETTTDVGICVTTCTDDSDCSSGMACDTGANACYETCTEVGNTECKDGYACTIGLDDSARGYKCRQDIDGDALSVDMEQLWGTSIYEEDTDGDGYSDYDEIYVYGTEPTGAYIATKVTAASISSGTLGSDFRFYTMRNGQVDSDFNLGIFETDGTYTRDASREPDEATPLVIAISAGEWAGLEAATISITTDNVENPTLDVYLPRIEEGDVSGSGYLAFYIAEDGSTYYAATSKDFEIARDLNWAGYQIQEEYLTRAAGEVLDADGDGLTDEEEAVLGTDPDEDDTDGDILNDGYEVHTYGTDPLDADSDDDGLDDYTEVRSIGSDPNSDDLHFKLADFTDSDMRTGTGTGSTYFGLTEESQNQYEATDINDGDGKEENPQWTGPRDDGSYYMYVNADRYLKFDAEYGLEPSEWIIIQLDFKPHSGYKSQNGNILTKEWSSNCNDPAYRIEQEEDNFKLSMRIGGHTYTVTSEAETDGDWQTIKGIYDGKKVWIDVDGDVTYYGEGEDTWNRNGVEVTGSLGMPGQSYFYIGKNDNCNDDSAMGHLDEVYIWGE